MKYFLIFLLNSILISLFSQNDSILQGKIDSVLISTEATKKNILLNESIFNIQISKNNPFTSIDKILENNVNISLKKYGEGQISTISLKGFNASQTDVFWNGVKLNSPMLNQADLSTITIGNNTTLKIMDSDNISDAIALDNNIGFNKRNDIKFTTSIGSFANFNQAISFEFASKKKYYSNTNISFNKNFNKYKYINKSLPQSDYVFLENSEVISFHFEQVNAFKFSKGNIFRFYFKTFFADRNIPPTIFEGFSTKNQKDNLYLGKIEWKKLFKKASFKINTAFVNQQLKYSLSKHSKVIINASNSVQTNIVYKNHLNSLNTFSLELNNTIENGNSESYATNVWRNKLSLKTGLRGKLLRNIFYKLNLTEILLNNTFSELLPDVSIYYSKKNLPANLQLKFNYRRKIKFPSFNDLYWNPGGNFNLEAEKAHSLNFIIFLEREITKNKFYFHNKFEWFNIFSENYIQWQPTNNGFWQAINIKNVYSRGFTNDFKIDYKINENFNLKNTFSFNYTRITKMNQNEQLIYVPISNLYNATTLKTKWGSLSLNQQNISQKYINYNNSESLKAYYLLDLIVSKEFKFKNNDEFQVMLEINNIFNTTYFTYVNRPLPRRNFFLKFNYKFRK